MELVTNFKALCNSIFDNYEDISEITMGILIADYRQTEAREYILNYLNRFDYLSGKYIDFYLPGYYLYANESENEWKQRQHYNIDISKHCSSDTHIYLDRTNASYYFDEYLFEDFLREFQKETKIKYSYNPMLILIGVNKKSGGQIGFQDKIVIDLEKEPYGGVRKSGQLFEDIFNIAKREVNLERFGHRLKLRFIKGNVANKIAKLLDGNILESVDEIAEGIGKYKIK